MYIVVLTDQIPTQNLCSIIVSVVVVVGNKVAQRPGSVGTAESRVIRPCRQFLPCRSQ